jgi:hypothetical protein
MASSFKNAGMSVVTTDDASANLYTAGGSTFYHVGKSLEIDVNNTLVLDKPINLETNDIIRIVAELNVDSSSPDVEAYASILEIS